MDPDLKSLYVLKHTGTVIGGFSNVPVLFIFIFLHFAHQLFREETGSQNQVRMKRVEAMLCWIQAESGLASDWIRVHNVPAPLSYIFGILFEGH
jgi:hypothetical protein